MTQSATPSACPPEPSARDLPWASAGQWSAVNEALVFFKGTHGGRLRQVFRLAETVWSAIRARHLMAAELALSSCRFCPAPCCYTAAPWYDFTDLLLIHFGGHCAPPGQPIARYGDTCRYLGPSGCRLPRPQRPWICAWYTCPVQWAALSRQPERHREYVAWTARIQSQRRQLERAFIENTAGRSNPPPPRQRQRR